MNSRMIKKTIFYETDFFMTQNAPQAILIKQNVLQARFFD